MPVYIAVQAAAQMYRVTEVPLETWVDCSASKSPYSQEQNLSRTLACVQVFFHMQNAARTDKGCMPNVITYSALITAFVAGGRLDKAYEIFLSMRSSNVHPDHICYSTLIAGVYNLCNRPLRSSSAYHSGAGLCFRPIISFTPG